MQYAVWGREEWAASLRAGHNARDSLEAEFSRRYQAPVYAINAARVGAQLALQVFASKRPGRTRVVLPAYICPSVCQAVRAVGLKPVFAAVGSDLNLDPGACERVLQMHRGQVLAVLAAHMYACPAQIAALAALCDREDCFLIDDAAHAPLLGGLGALVGGRGHVGLVSFAQSKTLVTGVRGSGGMLVVNDPTLVAPLTRAVEALPASRGRRAAWWHFVTRYLAPAPVGAVCTQLARWVPLPTRDGFSPARMAPFEAGIALAQTRKLEAIVTARSAVVQAYGQHLAAWMPQFEPGRYLSKVMVRMPQPGLREHLHARGIHTRSGYSTVAGELVELPLDVTMCTELVARVCEIVQGFVSRYADRPVSLSLPPYLTTHTQPTHSCVTSPC